MIYVRINKSGSTSVSTFVQDHCSILQVSKVAERCNRLAGWKDLESIKKEPCFTVVRNPFTRAVSQWQHCVRLGHTYSFEQWLMKDFHIMQPRERIHSIRQVDFLMDCAGSIEWVNHVLKLEDPELEKKIKDLTGATGSLEHKAKGGYETKRYYSDQAKELVKLKYWLDFKILRYKNKME